LEINFTARSLKIELLVSALINTPRVVCPHVRETKGIQPSDAEQVLLLNWSFNMKKFFNDESGATAIEYGLIAAAIGLMLVTAMPTLRAALSTKFGSISTGVSSFT
jgi:pilus assembly protein Flp/PilA